MNRNNIVQHNYENTRFARNQSDSCLDHIYSNVPQKISDMTTHRNNFSDHSYITAYYNSKEQIYQPKFIKNKK